MAHAHPRGRLEPLASRHLRVRDAAEADLDALVRLKPSPAVHRDRLGDARGPGFRYLVLERDGGVIGFVCLVFVRPRYWSDGESADCLPSAIDLLVDPAWRGRGYGSFLLRETERLAGEAGASALYVWVDPLQNPRACALYRRLGYEPLQDEPYRFRWEFVDSDGLPHSGAGWRLDLVRAL